MEGLLRKESKGEGVQKLRGEPATRISSTRSQALKTSNKTLSLSQTQELLQLYDGKAVGHAGESGGVDIVAVHGLRGHPIRSFTDPSTGCCWLRDLLPEDVPNSRVYSYGYSYGMGTVFEEPTMSDSIHDLARDFLFSLRVERGDGNSERPLIFIGHNLGGLLIKSALVQASSRPQSIHIVRFTAGVLFMGTPQREGLTDWGTIMTRLSDMVAEPTDATLSYSMRFDSASLQDLDRQFVTLGAKQNIYVWSFYETIQKAQSPIVERASVVLGLPHETVRPLQSSHVELCRYPNSDSVNYQIVDQALQELYRTSSDRSAPPEYFHLATMTDRDSLSGWVPNIVCNHGATSTGLGEVVGSMDEPWDFHDADIDIVAVHGLGGSAHRTWINSAAQTLWLRDFLQRDFPRSRIMSYGYDAEVAISNRTLDLSSLASDMLENIIQARPSEKEKRRRLILIGYSFGGLVIKKALLLLQEKLRAHTMENMYVELLEAVEQLIFLGVPHNDSTRWIDILRCTCRLKDLESGYDSAFMEQIGRTMEDFQSLEELLLYSASVVESKPVQVPRTRRKVLLVSSSSAQLGWGERETIYIAKNRSHLDLSAYRTCEDPAYRYVRETVSKALKRIRLFPEPDEIEACLDVLRRRQLSSSRKFANIPSPFEGSCDWFLEVPEVRMWLETLDGFLVVRGSPGCGKSVLAKHLLHHLSTFATAHSEVLYYTFDSCATPSTSEDLLASFIYQLFKKVPTPSGKSKLATAFRALGSEFASFQDTLLDALLSMLSECGNERIFVILDSIDECTAMTSLLQLLERMRRSRGPGSVTFLLTARTTSIRLPPDSIIIDWHDKPSDSGLRIVIEQRLKNLGLYPLDRKSVLYALGTPKTFRDQFFPFLYADLLFKNVEQYLAKGDPIADIISQSTISYPFGLRKIYHDMFRQLKEKRTSYDWHAVCELIKLMMVVFRPLGVQILVDMLNASNNSDSAITHLEDSYHTIYTVEHVGDVLTDLVSLGLVVEVEDNDKRHFRFLHFSVLEYLKSSTHFDITEKTIWRAHFELATKCIAQIQLVSGPPAFDPSDLDDTFFKYATTYWIAHISECSRTHTNSDNDRRVSNFAYALFQNTELRERCLFLYEFARTERLPRHSVFEPLFGGAYFGLLPLVRKALSLGADLEAQDEDGKTALYWASEFGHCSIMEALLDGGADVNMANYNGWTALHSAALRGDLKVVSLLCKAGADIDSVDNAGRSPLHYAVENGKVDVIHHLLESGADATQKSNSGMSILQLAQKSSSKDTVEALMETSKASVMLLRRAVFDNESTTLKLLFSWRKDIVQEHYPWVEELLEELTTEEILNLLLMSENLNWMPLDEPRRQPESDWKDILTPEHHCNCAHRLNGLETNRPGVIQMSSSTDSSGDEQRQDAIDQAEAVTRAAGMGPVHSEPTDSKKSSSNFRDPEQHFPDLEKREQDLISICGIAGVFMPEFGETNPGYALMCRNAAQIMFGRPPVLSSLFPVDITTEIPALQYNVPSNSEKEMDSAPYLSIDSSTSETSHTSYDSTANGRKFEPWDRDTAKKIMVALLNVLKAIAFLHEQVQCCDRVTVIVKPVERDKVLELRTISSADLNILSQKLEEFCEPSETKMIGWTSPLADLCRKILSAVCFANLADEHLGGTSVPGQTLSPNRCLHLCALIVQIASLGVVTYSRGHSREFDTEALTRSIDAFILGGVEHYWSPVCAERVELSCMGKMLGRKVWIFHEDKSSIGTFNDIFLLSATAEDVLDTWGGWASTQNNDQGLAICLHTGGGLIARAEDAAVEHVIVDGETCCHWSSGHEFVQREQWFVPLDTRFLIGATQQNLACPLIHSVAHEAITPMLSPLGTRSPSWRFTGRSAGISGAHHGGASLTLTQTKDDGRNLKRLLVDGYQENQDLRKLNSPWGLELSLCTGIARRVLLRQLIYDEALECLRLGLPGEWQTIEAIMSTISEISNREFDDLLNKLTEKQAEVLRKAVELLIIATEFTGVESDGHTLTMWWPERYAPEPRGIKFRKKQYSGKNPWISMIKDSEHCAVFGMVTTRCLQHKNIKKCRRKGLNSIWQDVHKIMMDTTLSPVEQVSKLSYGKDEKYLLWKRQDFLQVTKPKEETEEFVAGIVQLTYRPGSKIPRIVQRELRKVVREKSGREDSGQGVLIL